MDRSTTHGSCVRMFFDLMDAEIETEEQLLEEEELALHLLYPGRRRKIWVHSILLQRLSFGEFHTLVQELESDSQRFKQYFRMSKIQFDQLLSIVEDELTKQTTHFKRPIGARERLGLTLRYMSGFF